MTEYTKWCWNCGSKKIFPVETWFKCDDCGATHVPAGDIIDMGPMETTYTGYPDRQTFSPTKRAQSAAARVRNEKATAERGKAV